MRGAARRPTSAGETAAVSGSLQNQAAGNSPCLLPNTANKTQVGATGNGAHAACLPLRSSRPCWQRTTTGPTSAIANQGSQADCGATSFGPTAQQTDNSQQSQGAWALPPKHPKREEKVKRQVSIHQSLSAATRALLFESLCGMSDSGDNLSRFGLVVPPMTGSFTLGVKDLASS